MGAELRDTVGGSDGSSVGNVVGLLDGLLVGTDDGSFELETISM